MQQTARRRFLFFVPRSFYSSFVLLVSLLVSLFFSESTWASACKPPTMPSGLITLFRTDQFTQYVSGYYSGGRVIKLDTRERLPVDYAFPIEGLTLFGSEVAYQVDTPYQKYNAAGKLESFVEIAVSGRASHELYIVNQDPIDNKYWVEYWRFPIEEHGYRALWRPIYVTSGVPLLFEEPIVEVVGDGYIPPDPSGFYTDHAMKRLLTRNGIEQIPVPETGWRTSIPEEKRVVKRYRLIEVPADQIAHLNDIYVDFEGRFLMLLGQIPRSIRFNGEEVEILESYVFRVPLPDLSDQGLKLIDWTVPPIDAEEMVIVAQPGVLDSKPQGSPIRNAKLSGFYNLMRVNDSSLALTQSLYRKKSTVDATTFVDLGSDGTIDQVSAPNREKLDGRLQWPATSIRAVEQPGTGRIYQVSDRGCVVSGYDGYLIDSDNDGDFDRSITQAENFDSDAEDIIDWGELVWPQ